jgi:hypothetical protein
MFELIHFNLHVLNNLYELATLSYICKYTYRINFALLPSNNTDDGMVERELEIEDSTVSQFDESPIEKTLESLFEQVTSPTKPGHQSEIARFNDNTLLYISPQTKTLHSDILKNSPANLSNHNNNTIQASQKKTC